MSDLPRGWVSTRLGELGTWSSGGTPLRKYPEYYGGEIPWVKTGDLKDQLLSDTPEKITPDGLKNSSAKLFPKGTLLIAMYGATIGKTARLALEASTNQACAAFMSEGSSGDVIPYLWRYVIGKRSDFIAAGQGGAQPNISQALIKEFPIDLPPLAEQKRIVAKLDALSARSARARKDLARIDTLVKRYKQAVLSKAFSGELTKDWRNHCHDETPIEPLSSKLPDDREGVFQQTTGQDLPSNWRSLKLGQLGKVLGGGTPNKKEPSYWGGPIPWVTPKDMKVDQIVGAIDTITEVGLNESSAKLVPEASLLFVVRGMILAHSFPVAINKRTVTVNQDMKALTPLSDLLPEYLLFGLKSLKDTVVQLAGSATHGTKRLESGVILNMAIPVAPFAEQQEVVRRIESAFQKIDKLAAEAKRALELTDKLDEAILAKAFRGELVPQDPNDEHASRLLDRIKAERAAAPKVKRVRKSWRPKQENSQMEKTVIEVLKAADGWLEAPKLFEACGVRDGSFTQEVEEIYKQLLVLERQEKNCN